MVARQEPECGGQGLAAPARDVAAGMAAMRAHFDQAYRRMLRRAAQLLSGDDVPEDESLAQFKERLAQLGVSVWRYR